MGNERNTKYLFHITKDSENGDITNLIYFLIHKNLLVFYLSSKNNKEESQHCCKGLKSEVVIINIWPGKSYYQQSLISQKKKIFEKVEWEFSEDNVENVLHVLLLK